jgi:glucokinase
MPGPFDYKNGISYIKGLNKYEALYDVNIKQHFAALLNLSPREIRFRNDAEATIAGEVLSGAAKHLDNVIGVTLGTGFGSAYCQEQVTKDLNLGGDLFKDSIADDYLSTRWFLTRYQELTGISLTGVKELATIAEVSLTAKQIFEEFAMNMSVFLTKPLNWFKPQALMLGGNIAKASALFLTSLKLRLAGTTIILAELGEQAALIGAAALFKQQKDVEI